MINGLSSMVNREKKDLAQIVTWRGLNKTDGATDGFLSDCTNLTADNYPTLSPRKGRTVAETLTNPTALYAWDKLCYVDDNILYYDGQPITNVTPGEKQFAVVGSRLCVWPDKIIVDLTNNEFIYADASFETTGGAGSAVFTVNTITADAEPIKAKDYVGEIRGDTQHHNTLVYTYGSNASAVEACYTGGAWNLTALDAIQECKTFYMSGSDPYVSGLVAVGDIIILCEAAGQWWEQQTTYKLVTGLWLYEDEDTGEEYIEYPARNLYSDKGYYGIVTKRRIPDPRYTTVEITMDVYKVGASAPLFSSQFSIADTVSISGTLYGWYDADKLSITAISDSPNMLTLGAGTIWTEPICVRDVSSYLPISAGKKRIRMDSGGTTYYYHFEMTEDLTEENIILIVLDLGGGDYTTVFWDTVNKVERYRLPTTRSTSTVSGEASLGTGSAYETDTVKITIKRDVPQLDYICTWNNRLWGVVNNETTRIWNTEKNEWEESYSRVIYASALGMPWQFYDYSGLSTDSYAVVVASKGDFTGITAYSRSLLAWKENMMYRVSGDYPSDYLVYDYNIAGVKAGCHKSLRIINEVLYYKGRDGFYAYTGATPQLISYVLGENDGIARATATERKYYAAMDYGDEGEILVYDTLTNTWYREDDTLAADMTYSNGNVYFLKDNNLYIADDDNSTEDVEWSATFVRANETFHERKDYKWIRIRADMATDSTIKAEVSIDRGAFVTILPTTTVSGLKMFEIPMQNNRVDELVLRLSGKGAGKIRSVIREFHEGSAYCK